VGRLLVIPFVACAVLLGAGPARVYAVTPADEPAARAAAATLTGDLGDAPTLTDDLGDAPTLTGVVDTVEVTADRPNPLEALSTFAVAHAVVPSGGVATVADIIESGVGTHVRRYGGLGSYSTASIRASSPGQVEIYMDGVPLMSGAWGVVNLADLPLDGLDRIEIYRGGSPVDFGTPGIGGVINLVTRPAGVGRSFAALTGGSHGTKKLDLLQSGSFRGVGYAVSFDHLRSEGDFDYLDRHGTPENPDDDEIVRRQNNDFRQSDLLARIALPAWRGWSLDASYDYFTKESGVPGIENVHIRSVRYEVFRNMARVSVTSPRLRDAFGFSATAFHQRRRDLFFNPDDEVGFSRSDTDNLSRAYGANVTATANWPAARQVVRLFAETRRERFTPSDENPAIGTGFTRKRSAMALSAEDGLFIGDSIEVTAGYRLQQSVDNYTGEVPFGAPPAPREKSNWSTFHGPSAGLRWRVHRHVTVRANRTHYARFPSMIELFGASGTVEGNTELTPEEGTTTDVGVSVDLSGREGRRADGYGSGGGAAALQTALELVLFRAERENLITFLQNSQRTVKAFNLESAEVEGAELSASLGVGRRDSGPGSARVTAAYTYQDARNTGPSPVYHRARARPGQRVARVPLRGGIVSRSGQPAGEPEPRAATAGRRRGSGAP
jgi:outer membrane cobalamin receptor